MTTGQHLAPGLYRVYWKDCDGYSVGAIGILPNGDRWIAPTNWVHPSSDGVVWEKIDYVTAIRYRGERE